MISHLRSLCALSAALLVGGACSSGATPAAEERALRDAFDAYVTAVAARDGDAAASHIGPATAAYYDDLKALALTADRATLTRRRLLDRLGALAIRASMDPATLEGLDGRTLYARAVTGGFVAGDARRLGISAVTVDGDQARAVMALDGHALPVTLSAVRRDGRWLVEPVSVMSAIDDSLSAIPRQLGRAEGPWLLDAVAAVVGHAVDETLWEAPRPAPR